MFMTFPPIVSLYMTCVNEKIPLNGVNFKTLILFKANCLFLEVQWGHMKTIEPWLFGALDSRAASEASADFTPVHVVYV